MIWSHNVKIRGSDQPRQHCCKEDNMIWNHSVKITGNDQPRQHRCKEDRYEYLEEKADSINELIN